MTHWDVATVEGKRFVGIHTTKGCAGDNDGNRRRACICFF